MKVPQEVDSNLAIAIVVLVTSIFAFIFFIGEYSVL